jgi:uncharacterized protein YaiE (UPF0345 family)
MAISDSTLAQNVFTDVRSALVAASITTSIGSTVSSANILAAHPDKVYAKPQIVILPIQSDEGDFKFGGSEGRKAINVVIECYSDKSLGVDQLADGVRAALKANTITGIDLVGFSEDYAFNSPGENKFHLKTLTASYLRE